MAASIIRLNDGSIAVDGSGNVLKIDLSAAPSISLSHDWQYGRDGYPAYSPTPITLGFSATSGPRYRAEYQSLTLFLCYYYLFTVDLKLTGGHVRWEGTWELKAWRDGHEDDTAHVQAAIRLYCSAGKVNPAGTYTVTGTPVNDPTGYQTFATSGSSIVLS